MKVLTLSFVYGKSNKIVMATLTQFGSVPKISDAAVTFSCPTSPDYTIFWNREQLYAWYLKMKNTVPEPPKIRRQVPKKPRYERDDEE